MCSVLELLNAARFSVFNHEQHFDHLGVFKSKHDVSAFESLGCYGASECMRFHKVQVKALEEAIPAANAIVRVILFNANWVEEAKVVEEVNMVDFLDIPRRVQSQCSTIGWRF